MKAQIIINKIKQKEVNYILFDCFDTLICRDCSINHLRYLWAKELVKELDYLFSVKTLYEVRQLAEQNCQMNSLGNEYTFNDVVMEIYNRLKLINNNFKISYKLFVNKNIILEVNLEKEHQYLNHYMKEVLDFCKNNKYQIIMVSDFYFNRNIMSDFLQNLNILDYFKQIYISCDYKKSKHNLDLYELVLDKENIEPEKSIMIGDNEVSDIINAKKYKINTIKINDHYSVQDIITLKKKCKVKLKQIAKKGDLYDNYAFSLYRYIDTVYKYLLKEGADICFFLSREGEFLKKLFDTYDQDKKIFSNYLYVSRKALYPAILKPLDEEDFFDLPFSQGISLEDFLETLCFEKDVIKYFLDKYDNCIRYNNDNKNILITTLKKDHTFSKLYEENCIKQRKLILQYFEESGLIAQERIYLVDVGWNGTMQNCIYELFNREKMITGLYIGTNKKAISTDMNKKVGILFSSTPTLSKNYSIYTFDSTFFERICTASHPTTECYQLQEGKIAPVMKSYDKEKYNYEIIKNTQSQILEKFILIKKVFDQSIYEISDFNELFDTIHIKTIFNINMNQIGLQHILYNNQIQNFGGNLTASQTNEEVFSNKNILKKIIKKLKSLDFTGYSFEALFRFMIIKNKKIILWIVCKFIYLKEIMKYRLFK